MNLPALLALLTALTAAATGSPADLAAGAPTPGPAPTAYPAVVGRAGWGWPLDPVPAVLQRFDPPSVRWGQGHRGIDLAAAVGQTVLAPAAGTVTFSGVIAGRPVLVLTHPSGLRSTFEPVETRPSDPGVGSVVARGAPIGGVAATPGHCAPATCLHWGVLRERSYLDPLALLAGRVILLPPR